MASQNIATDIRIPLRKGGNDVWDVSRPYGLAAFNLIRGVEGIEDEAFAVTVDADCNARAVGLSHPDFAMTLRAPGSLGPFAKTEDMVVVNRQLARMEALLPEAHRAAKAKTLPLR